MKTLSNTARVFTILVMALAFLLPALHTQAQDKSKDDILIYRPRGTGRTTGHIITLSVANNSSRPLSITSETFYIPGGPRYQGYFGRTPETAPIPPGETMDVEIEGYCLDVHKSPVPDGEPATPFTDWVLVRDNRIPGGDGKVVPTPDNVAPPFTTSDIPGIESGPGFESVTPGPGDMFSPVYPGTDRPVRGVLSPEEAPTALAPVLVKLVEEIESASDEIAGNPLFPTPFSPDPPKELATVRQHTIWIATGELYGEPYIKEDFAGNVYEEFESSTGVAVTKLGAEEKEQLDAGVDAFWETFAATGYAAKVIKTGETDAGRAMAEKVDPRLAGTTGTTAPTSPRCLRTGTMPTIDARTGYDLIGDLYRNGHIQSDYLDDVRAGVLKRKVQSIQAMHASLENVLTTEFNLFPCDDETAHNEDHPVSYPQFPWDKVFLQVDLCADNSEKTHLYDYLHPDADPEALREWMSDLEWTIDNMGVWRPEEQRSYMAAWQAGINRSMEGIGEAYDDFEESLYVTLELRYNQSRAEAQMWGAVITIATALASAGTGALASGLWGAVASAFVSTTGFVWEQGVESMGADPAVANLVGSLVTLGIGVGQSWGRAFAEDFAEGAITSMSTDVMIAGASEMSQRNTEGFAMGMGMLMDDVWDEFIEQVSEDYRADAIAQLNRHRETLRSEMERHVKDLCKIYRSMDALLPGLLQAQREAERWLHSSYWRDLWQDGLGDAQDCCCEWSDGRPISGCVIDLPEFGYDAREENQ